MSLINAVYFLLCTLAVAKISYCENICTNVKTGCSCTLKNKTVINLESVGYKNDTPRFYMYGSSGKKDLYSYNPCHTFSDKNCKECNDINAYRLVPNSGAPLIEDLGGKNHVQFIMNGSLLSLNYTSKDGKRILIVNLVCDQKAKEPALVILESNDPNWVLMNLTSKCACPNGCKDPKDDDDDENHLSPGSILLIIFFTLLLAYLILGILWNYCNGAHNIELVPNIEFWRELPQLVMDGVIYTFTCCSPRRSTYSST